MCCCWSLHGYVDVVYLFCNLSRCLGLTQITGNHLFDASGKIQIRFEIQNSEFFFRFRHNRFHAWRGGELSHDPKLALSHWQKHSAKTSARDPGSSRYAAPPLFSLFIFILRPINCLNINFNIGDGTLHTNNITKK